LLGSGFDDYEDNIRAALEWTAKEGRPELIASAIVPVARVLIDPEEVNRWVQYVLAADNIDPDDHLTALSVSSFLGMIRLDPRMDDDAKRVIELAGGSPSRALANALLQRSLFISSAGQATQNDALEAEASALANEAVRVAEAGDWPTWRVAALTVLGQHFLIWERHTEAAEAFDAATHVRTSTPNVLLNRGLQNRAATGLALALYMDGERERAAEVARRTVDTDDEDFFRFGSLDAVMALLISGAHDRAREALHSLVADVRHAAIPLANSEWFVGFAAIGVEEGDMPRAARLLAAARALGSHAIVQFRSPDSYAVYRHYVRIVRAALTAEDAHRYRDEGRAMSTDEALAYALEVPVSSK
jgi:tetratricopeptide (TPR) repeat protein